MPETETGHPVLVAEGISKQFPGVRALEQVSITVRAGEVHGLLGENGAGKSTLVKILSGVHQPDGGRLLLDGREVRFKSPHEAQAAGIVALQQEFSLVLDLSVAENIFLGREPVRRLAGLRFVDHRQMNASATAILKDLDVRCEARAPVRTLSPPVRQMVQIARALASGARVIILDEPTAALTHEEAQRLFVLVRRLKRQGVAFIYISHHLEEIPEITDHLTFLRDGTLVTSRPTAGTDVPAMVRLMVGRDVEAALRPPLLVRGEERLRVEGLTRRGAFADVSLTVHAGEIVGLYGLVGAGRTELLRAIFGLDPVDAGAVALAGQAVKIASPLQAVRAGMGLVPEERKTQGLILHESVRDNMCVARVAARGALGWQNRRWDQDFCLEMIRKLGIRTPGPQQAVGNLSGGNQQKVVVARWLGTDTRIFLFDEPTRGVDVGAKAEIYQLMLELAAQGAAILLASSELPELLRLSDRVLVMCRGRVTLQGEKAHLSEEQILHAAFGTMQSA